MFIGACFDKDTALESFSAFTDPDFKFKFFLVGEKNTRFFYIGTIIMCWAALKRRTCAS